MILVGGALGWLRELEAGSVQTVVTSPPYFGLRDYGTGEWEGGDPECGHVAPARSSTADGMAALAERYAGGSRQVVESRVQQHAGVCGKCGARRVDEQIGLEASPEEYVAALVAVFAEVRRVLRADGTVWLNVGDSYCNIGHGKSNRGDGRAAAGHRATEGTYEKGRGSAKHKDLLGIPWLLAFALRADGWYLRSEIVWAKPNPMPESVMDRPTSAHEKLFLLSKRPTYFYDADAIRERSPANERARTDFRAPGAQDAERLAMGAAGNRNGTRHGAGRNKRNVWTVATVAFADAHFATFPPKLVVPCVLAGSSPRACGECGAPWARVTERVPSGWDGSRYGERAVEAAGGALTGGTERSTLGSSNGTETAAVRTTGWEATCGHDDAGEGRCVVLDPFAGSGTVGVVCAWHGREFVGLELNPEYARMAEARIATEGVLGRRAYRPEREPDAQLGFEV